MNNWYQTSIGEFVDFNPSESIKKGTEAKKIPMEKLGTFERKIKGYETSEYNSGPKFRNEDTLVAKITPCLENGKTAYVDLLDEGEVAFGSSEFIVLRANENSDSQFVYYLARSPLFRERAISCMEGTSGRKRVNEGALKRQEILVPNLHYQQKIAAVLSSLDDKIELNNKINAELEAMAKTLYDYWFVQFNFPISKEQALAMGNPKLEGKPYKTSGGKIVWNEVLKREIPEGWEVKNLYQIADFINGLACQKYRPENDTDDFLPVIKIREMNEGITSNTEKVRITIPEKNKINDGDILFSWSATLDVKIWAEGKGALNQHIFKVVSKDYPRSFYYFEVLNYLHHFKMMAELRKTTMGHITIDHLKTSFIAIPNKDLINKLHKKIDVLFTKIISTKKQNQELASLRDWLLPLLMNGQVTVADAEKQIKEVIAEKAQTPKQKNDSYFKIQMLYTTVWANKEIEVKQGEMATAKDVYLLDRIYGVETGFQFKQHNWGSFDPEEKKLLNTKQYFHKVNFPNSKAVYVDLKDDGKLLDKIPTHLKETVSNAISEMNATVFSRYFGTQKAEKKELFATALKCIEDRQSLELSIIRDEMAHWKIKQGGKESTKADKFTEAETREALEMIIKEKWHRNVMR